MLGDHGHYSSEKQSRGGAVPPHPPPARTRGGAVGRCGRLPAIACGPRTLALIRSINGYMMNMVCCGMNVVLHVTLNIMECCGKYCAAGGGPDGPDARANQE